MDLPSRAAPCPLNHPPECAHLPRHKPHLAANTPNWGRQPGSQRSVRGHRIPAIKEEVPLTTGHQGGPIPRLSGSLTRRVPEVSPNGLWNLQPVTPLRYSFVEKPCLLADTCPVQEGAKYKDIFFHNSDRTNEESNSGRKGKLFKRSKTFH